MSSSEFVGPAPAGGEASAQIELSARLSSIELSLVASDFRPLATGLGRLSAAVPPGIYQVVARAGPVIERKLIQVAAGGVYRDDTVDVRFPASAPVTDTTTSHEYQQAATEQASAAVANQPGPPSGLVIVVRDTRGDEGPPLEPGDVAAFDLLDESMLSVAGFADGWQIQAKEAVATWGRRLPPGGYALRTDPARAAPGSRVPASSQVVDQSIWLSENWQTVVFITTGPGGPRTSAASVHMGDIGLGWSAYDKEVGQALELANWGLREGRSAVPDNLVNVLLNTKFVNPMLGIIGAHSLLLHPQPDAGVLDMVLDNLEGMLPGHPDVAALRWMATVERPILPAGGAAGTAALGGASWPPMLLPSYRALIAMDAVNSGAIADRSVAERAAANLLVQGIWTTWKPIEPLPPMAPPRPPPSPREGQPSAGAGAPVRPSVSPLAALGRDPALLERVKATDPATLRVAAYLSALSALEGSTRRGQRFATLTPAEISLATTLPVASVDRALDRIATAIAPGGGGAAESGHGEGSGGAGQATGGSGSAANRRGGGSGPSLKGILTFLVAGGLLLGGVVGAIAVCSGSDLCAPGTSVVDTPVPTQQPTFLPSLTVSLDPETDAPPTATPSPSAEPTAVPIQHDLDVPFGPVTIGSAPRQIVYSVLASAEVPLTFALIDNPDLAFVVPGTCDWAAATETDLRCSIVVQFTPLREGLHAASFEVRRGDGGQAVPIALSGEGVPLLIDPLGPIDFGIATFNRDTAIQQVTLTAVEMLPVEFTIPDNDFNVFGTDTATCQWVSATGAAPFVCTVSVAFRPTADMNYKATLVIAYGGPTASVTPPTIQLIGNGDPQFG